MLVFFRNIPAQAKCSDLIAFSRSAFKTSWFRKKAVIESIKIIHLQDSQANTSEFHCVMEIQPEASARRVIARLNRQSLEGRYFNGRYIIVREYQRRVWHNDPRLNHQHKADVEKRVADRRRNKISVIKEDETKFSSQKTFYREFN